MYNENATLRTLPATGIVLQAYFIKQGDLQTLKRCQSPACASQRLSAGWVRKDKR